MLEGMWRVLCDWRYVERVLCDGRCVKRVLCDWRYVVSFV